MDVIRLNALDPGTLNSVNKIIGQYGYTVRQANRVQGKFSA